jgi:putative molybdopterin biosynthesis protein
MIDVKINEKTATPKYKQIVEQVKRQIASLHIKADERMPSIKEMAKSLQISPTTVSRAYRYLQYEGLLKAGTCSRTVVTGSAKESRLPNTSYNQLTGLVNDLLLESLHLGYLPEELPTMVSLQLARWQIDADQAERVFWGAGTPASMIRVAGVDDTSLDLLLNLFQFKQPTVRVRRVSTGSLGGLLSLQQGKADLALIQLFANEAIEEYCLIIKRVYPDRFVLMLLSRLTLGFAVPAGNPNKFSDPADFRRPHFSFLNLNRKYGNRIWLDRVLWQRGIQPDKVKGYHRELDSYLDIACAILRGEANIGLGSGPISAACGLGLVPSETVSNYLVVPVRNLVYPVFASFFDAVNGTAFKQAVGLLEGYDTSSNGKVIYGE